MFAQSGGRQTITYKVFDWIELPLTAEEWSALGMNVYNQMRPTIEEQLQESLDPYEHILIGIDHPGSSGGTTPGALTLLAASNFSPSFMAHELGHRFGARDAFGETANGAVRYRNRFCVMGAMGWPAVFTDDALTDPVAPGLDQSGPGMSAPSLMATGWLDEDGHGLGVELSSTNVSTGGGTIQELSALEGAPGPGWLRPPLVIRYGDFLIEYRVRTATGWDRGLPDPGDGAVGWLVVHRSPRGAPVAVHVKSIGAQPGAVLVLGEDNPVDIFHAGPPILRVLSFNADARTVRFHLWRRAARELPGGVTYGGVDVGGGGLVWTPGRGFTRVPPHSPLVKVLEQVAQIHALQELLPITSGDEAAGLLDQVSLELRALQENVSVLRAEPALSPLEQAMASISEIQQLTERLATDTENHELTQHLLDASRQQLTEVQNILGSKVEQERRM